MSLNRDFPYEVEPETDPGPGWSSIQRQWRNRDGRTKAARASPRRTRANHSPNSVRVDIELRALNHGWELQGVSIIGDHEAKYQYLGASKIGHRKPWVGGAARGSVGVNLKIRIEYGLSVADRN
jgi:hypothetical protein